MDRDQLQALYEAMLDALIVLQNATDTVGNVYHSGVHDRLHDQMKLVRAEIDSMDKPVIIDKTGWDNLVYSYELKNPLYCYEHRSFHCECDRKDRG